MGPDFSAISRDREFTQRMAQQRWGVQGRSPCVARRGPGEPSKGSPGGVGAPQAAHGVLLSPRTKGCGRVPTRRIRKTTFPADIHKAPGTHKKKSMYVCERRIFSIHARSCAASPFWPRPQKGPKGPPGVPPGPHGATSRFSLQENRPGVVTEKVHLYRERGLRPLNNPRIKYTPRRYGRTSIYLFAGPFAPMYGWRFIIGAANGKGRPMAAAYGRVGAAPGAEAAPVRDYCIPACLSPAQGICTSANTQTTSISAPK